MELRPVAPARALTISTKVGRLLDWRGTTPGADKVSMVMPRFDYSRDATYRSLEASVQRMGLDGFGIVYVHDLSPRWHGSELPVRMAEALDGAFPALSELKAAGTIRAVGVGTNDPVSCIELLERTDLDVIMLAGCCTLLNQSGAAALLPTCAGRGIAVVAAAPFNSGILATGATPGATYFYQQASAEIIERTRAVEAVANRHGVPLPAAALQIALGQRAVVSTVVGMASAEEAKANIAYMNWDIPDDFWRELIADGLLPDNTPLPLHGAR